jgi:hypothetical protein
MTAKSVYLLSVFYNKIHTAELAKVKPILNSVSGGDHTALEYDSSSAAFAFTSDLSHKQLHQSLAPLVSENLRYLLVEIRAVVSTSMSQKALDWMAHRLTPGQR